MSFTESAYENAIIELLRDKLGYSYLYGPDVARDFHNPLLEPVLFESIAAVNKGRHPDAVGEAIRKLKNIESGSLLQKNAVFTDYLQNGIEAGYFENGVQKYTRVNLVDYETPENNTFYVVNQWTVIENETKRPDVVLFVNGLPVVLVELKSCAREKTDVSEAYKQIRNYMKEIPSMFIYNAVCVISDLSASRAGTITADEERFMEWKTVNGDYEETQFAMFNVLFEGMFEKSRILDILKNFIVFSAETPTAAKILAGYHQYFAVKKAIVSTERAAKTDGKGGVFWHTQGSGKSLSMVFYAKQIQEVLQCPTILVITDRNDLDDQLFGQFARCKDFLRQVPVQAESRVNLKQLLENRQANGIIFTTMQKFEESAEALSQRRNIVVMADEAHRGQYGLEEKVDAKTGKVSLGTVRIIRDSLPNATFVGFTGTPISYKDRDTREVFGDYIDIYDMTQSVLDGATRPVYYESRVINLGLNENVLREIDRKYEVLAEKAEPYDIEKSKKELGQMESILGAPQTIDALCRDIVAHYEDRQDILTGKAMIVAYSRQTAMKIYEKILELRPEWTEKVKVVMTAGNDDPEDWRDIIGNKTYKAELAKNFKDNGHPLKIAIVVDMWLTGFDVPSLATMYIYKPMTGHTLMQAIARVNRVFRDKEGGLIVDYVGIAKDLKQAMNDYTKRDHDNYGEMDIAATALPKFKEKLTVCKELFYGFDMSKFMDGTDLERATTISQGVNFILGDEKQKELFIREAMLLQQAQTLCRSLLNKTQRFEAAFFEAVRTALTRITGPGKFSLKDINAQINELLKQSIKSEGVIDLFADAKKEFSLFDPDFLQEIANMKSKNLVAELLKKLIAEQVSIYRRTNLVKSEKFSERLQKLMNAYRNAVISNAEVIEELLRMAKEIADDRKAGEDLGLNTEEAAFYDALTKPEAIKDFYQNDELVQMTKELTELLKSSKTVDWQKKETARAGMRRMVKHLLKKYKYPPDGIEDATATVIAQCEMWTDNEEM